MEERRKKIRSRYVRTGLAVFTAGLGLLLCYYMMYSTDKVREIVGTVNDILTPFYLGIIMAYLLCPIYNGTLRAVYKVD